MDATNNGDCLFLSHKLTSAPELSKHLTTSQCSHIDAQELSKHLTTSQCSHIDAPELSKHLTTSQCPSIDGYKQW
jgi:hypothetical protein